jgi:hypothetical protein
MYMSDEKYLIVLVDNSGQTSSVECYFQFLPNITVDVITHIDELAHFIEKRSPDLLLYLSADAGTWNGGMKHSIPALRKQKMGDEIPVVIINELPPPETIFELLK